MKKNLQLVFVLFALTSMIASCNKDEGETDFNSQFVGTWQSTSLVSTGCNDSEENGTLTCTPYCFRVVFESDNTYTLTDGTGDEVDIETGTYSATEASLSLCEDGTCDSDPATYIFINETSITVTFTDDESPGCQFTASFSKS